MGFIKTIGDAVMFVSTDAAALLRAALELLVAAEKEDMPPLRVGLAAGSAVRRAGDWFGSPVNLASRVTAVARPVTVLVAESARDLIGESDEFNRSFAGARHVKGVKGEVKLFRARKAGTRNRAASQRRIRPLTRGRIRFTSVTSESFAPLNSNSG